MTDLEQIFQQLKQSRTETDETLELLQASRQRVEDNSKQLESPKAVLEYIDFFVDLLRRAAADIDRVAAELADGLRPDHVDVLRQLASNGAVEQRRCVMFRDKWINRPLPYEQVRPLLNQISVDSRDQLTAYRSLNQVAERLQEMMGAAPKPPDSDKLDRRALFTRWFGN